MMFYKVAPFVLGIVLLAGCGGTVDLQERVEEHNYKVDRALSLYEESKVEGVSIRDTFIEAIGTQNELVFSKVTASRNTEVSGKAIDAVTGVMYEVDSYVEANNDYVRVTLEDGDEPITELITDTGVFTESLLQEKFLLDDTTGTVEQMLLVELPSGVITGVSFYWLGGVIYDVQQIR